MALPIVWEIVAPWPARSDGSFPVGTIPVRLASGLYNSPVAQILIVDDDLSLLDVLSEHVRKLGHDVSRARTRAEGIEKARRRPYDVVFLDVHLTDGDGLSMIPDLLATDSRPEIIIITGRGDSDGAELAIKSGAWDYIQKSSSLTAITLSLTRAVQYRERTRASGVPVALKTQGIVGDSPAMRTCLDHLAQAAVSDASVLVVGETGTGKELMARAVHENSSRARGPFVVVDCAALPETLVESVLFGHVRGAFTGADKPRDGLIKQADGGTLFLDEIGDLPKAIQKSFLRVLQERRLRPVGSDQEVHSDFRLVAATHRDLEQMAKDGTFREDLLFRIRAITLELPSLRKRAEDVKTLATYYLGRLCDKYATEAKGISKELFEALASYEWPGNVRELVQTMEGAFAAAHNEPLLCPYHLPTEIRAHLARAAFEQPEPDCGVRPAEVTKGLDTLPSWKEFRKEQERQYVERLVAECEGSCRVACQQSGLSRSRLYQMLREHGLSISDSAD